MGGHCAEGRRKKKQRGKRQLLFKTGIYLHISVPPGFHY